MRVAIFGAGAIGGLVGAVLHRAGAEVSVVARGAHLQAIRENGLSVVVGDEIWTCPVRASDRPAELGPQDLVVVAVKAPSLPEIAAGIGPLLGSSTAVAFLMNGVPWWYFHGHGGRHEGRRIPLVDPEGVVWSAIGPERAIGGVVRCAAVVEAPGRIRVTGTIREMLLGEPDGKPSPRCRDFRDLLDAGGIDAGIADDIRDAVWGKLVGNLMDGPLAMLTQAKSDAIFSDEACASIARAIGRETVALGKAMGRTIGVDVDQIVESGRRRVHLPSIAGDLLRGRVTEFDALIGVPLAWAAELGIAMPTLETMAGLVRLRLRAAGL